MFLSFEGIDGCGKTTQLRRAEAFLSARGVEVVTTREPGGTQFAEDVRELLLHSPQKLESATELLLFGAARAQHVAQVIRPALSRGAWVLCDRFFDSSEAYQGAGLGLDAAFIRAMNAFAVAECVPHRTFLFDLAPEIGQQRRFGEKNDKIEARGLEFQAQVRDGFLQIARRETARFVVMDAARDVETVWSAVETELRKLLEK